MERLNKEMKNLKVKEQWKIEGKKFIKEKGKLKKK